MLKWLLKADHTADVIVRWGGMYLIVAGILGSLARNARWFGHLNWAELILTAMFGALLAILFAAASLALFRYYRPIQGAQSILPVPDHERPDLGHLAVLDGRIDQIDQVSQNFLARLGKVHERLQEIERRLDGAAANQSIDEQRYRQQFASIYDALAAIYHRERLRFLGDQIEEGAKELGAATNDRELAYGEEEWEIWQGKERVWRFVLESWCELASCYVRDIGKTVLTAEADHYKQKGQAQLDQFPDAEAYIGYKEFCALWKNFHQWRDEVAKAVHRAAFNGGTATNRPMVPGAGNVENGG